MALDHPENILEWTARKVRDSFRAGKLANPGPPNLWLEVEAEVADRRPHVVLLMHHLALRVDPDPQLLKLIGVNDLRHESSTCTPMDKIHQLIVATIMYLIVSDDIVIEEMSTTHNKLHFGEDGLYTGFIAQQRTAA